MTYQESGDHLRGEQDDGSYPVRAGEHQRACPISSSCATRKSGKAGDLSTAAGSLLTEKLGGGCWA